MSTEEVARFVITAKGMPYPIDFYDLESEEWGVRQSAFRTDVRISGTVTLVRALSMLTVVRSRLEHVPSVHVEAEMRPIRRKTGCVVS